MERNKVKLCCSGTFCIYFPGSEKGAGLSKKLRKVHRRHFGSPGTMLFFQEGCHWRWQWPWGQLFIYLKLKILLYETQNLRVCKIWTWQLDILFITFISKPFQTEIHLGLIKNCQDWPLKKLPQITISSSLVAVGIHMWRWCLFCHFRNNSVWSGAF